MKHTNKNHKRRNKKRQTKKYKRVGVGGGLWDAISSGITGKSSDNNENSLEKEAEDIFIKADKNKDNHLSGPEYEDAKQYLKNDNDELPWFVNVAGTDNKVDLHEFTAAYYFMRADQSSNGQGNLDRGEYANLRGLLPGASKIPYEQVDKDNNGIKFDEFLPLYYFAKANEPGPDGNVDDKLSDGEYRKAKLMSENMKKMPDFGEVDGDKSGTIDFKEFLTAYNNAKQSGGRRRKRSTRNKRKSNKKRRTVKRRKSAKKSHRRK